MEAKENKNVILPNQDWLKENSDSYVITINGEIKKISPKNGKFYTLEEMYKYCKTNIVEFVHLPYNRVMVVDEEGALKYNRKQNWFATKILSDAVDRWYGSVLDYFIYGDVMIIKDSELEDEYEDEELENVNYGEENN